MQIRPDYKIMAALSFRAASLPPLHVDDNLFI